MVIFPPVRGRGKGRWRYRWIEIFCSWCFSTWYYCLYFTWTLWHLPTTIAKALPSPHTCSLNELNCSILIKTAISALSLKILTPIIIIYNSYDYCFIISKKKLLSCKNCRITCPLFELARYGFKQQSINS